MPVRACGITSVIQAMIMKDATASACLELDSSGRGENHSPMGTAIVSTPPIILRPVGKARSAVRTVCSVVPTNEVDPQGASYLARRIVAPESSKLHSSHYPRRKFLHFSHS